MEHLRQDVRLKYSRDGMHDNPSSLYFLEIRLSVNLWDLNED